MKASIKKDSPENLYDFEEDTSYEDFAAEEKKKRQPYVELVEYISNNPALSTHFTDDKGNKTAKEITVDSLLNWEENFTNIYMSTVGDDPTIYVWRIFRRYEYLKTLGDTTSSATVDWDNDRQRQDFIIKSCLLFPNPSLYFRANSAAGVLPTLEKQILYKSGFIPDQEALSSINIIG